MGIDEETAVRRGTTPGASMGVLYTVLTTTSEVHFL